MNPMAVIVLIAVGIMFLGIGVSVLLQNRRRKG
jgi:hypothetical protein